MPAVLADRMATDIGMTSGWFFAAFSAALVISALVGPRVGRTVDDIGGREVLAASNVVMAFGLIALALVHSVPVLWLAWLVMGLGMGLGLYDTAFAALGRIYGATARPAITGITLIAGFASTVGWPLTAWGASELGWRETCAAWAIAIGQTRLNAYAGLAGAYIIREDEEDALGLPSGEHRSRRSSRMAASHPTGQCPRDGEAARQTPLASWVPRKARRRPEGGPSKGKQGDNAEYDHQAGVTQPLR